MNDLASLESLVAEVADEFLDRQKRGERPRVEEYTARHPRHATVLAEVLGALQVVGPLAGGPTALGELGDFLLLREVGRGGMGVVYEAEQRSLGRRVALKVLPFASTLDPKLLQRFKNESLAAAHLQHTHIVPVYATGCERGVHFYAMQFIDGQTLAAVIGELRCSPEPPSAKGRAHFRTVARLGVQAAEALEHAHQQGVIHRDIKPANLLVDGRGQLWVTDFGLAHYQSQGGLTMTGDLVGTLRYMSPEQALARRVALDHRGDVYSLGATLYELLTLEPAFAATDRQELLRQIALEEPRPPRRLNKAAPPELETIVLKAMEKNPADRYATAQELADDLERFLKDEPIRAKRPSLAQWSRKWARRHQPVVWSAAATLLMTLAVLAGSVGWVVGDRTARRAKAAADLRAAVEEAQQWRREGQWPRALAAARRAEAMLDDGGAGPALAESVRVLLAELAEEEADARFVGLLDKIRLAQTEVDVDRSRFVIEKALPEYRRVFGESGFLPGALSPGEAAAMVRRRPEAIRQALVASLDHWLQMAISRDAPEVGWLRRVLAAADSDPWRQRLRALLKSRDLPALVKLAREADATQSPAALIILFYALRARGAHDKGVALLRRAQGMFPGDFWVNQELGEALRECRPPRHEEAVRFLTVAVALRPENAGARLNLGVALRVCGRLDEAVAAYREAIRLRPDYAMAHNHLGGALLHMGQLDEAEAALRRAIALRPDRADAHFNLGLVLWRKGRLDEAAAAYREVIKREPEYAEAHCNLGLVLRKQGQAGPARDALRRGHELGSKRPDWRYPSADWLREAERRLSGEGALPVEK